MFTRFLTSPTRFLAARPRPLVILAGAAVVLAGAVALGGVSEPVRLLGKVKSVAEDAKSFQFQAKGGVYTVSLDEKTAIGVFVATPIKDCAQPLKIQVLGRRVEATEQSDAFIGSVVTIVGGDKFEPPPVPPDLAQKKIEWVQATLSVSQSGPPKADQYQLQVPKDRRIPVLTEGKPEAIEKGKIVFVDGVHASDKKKEITAKRATVLATEIPMTEYKAILGL